MPLTPLTPGRTIEHDEFTRGAPNAEILIAPSDTLSTAASIADYACDGEDDQVQLKAAWAAAKATRTPLRILPGTLTVRADSDCGLAITVASASTFTVAGDRTSQYPDNFPIYIVGSTAGTNDGKYTVSGTSHADGTTTFTVAGGLTAGLADEGALVVEGVGATGKSGVNLTIDVDDGDDFAIGDMVLVSGGGRQAGTQEMAEVIIRNSSQFHTLETDLRYAMPEGAVIEIAGSGEAANNGTFLVTAQPWYTDDVVVVDELRGVSWSVGDSMSWGASSTGTLESIEQAGGDTLMTITTSDTLPVAGETITDDDYSGGETLTVTERKTATVVTVRKSDGTASALVDDDYDDGDVYRTLEYSHGVTVGSVEDITGDTLTLAVPEGVADMGSARYRKQPYAMRVAVNDMGQFNLISQGLRSARIDLADSANCDVLHLTADSIGEYTNLALYHMDIGGNNDNQTCPHGWSSGLVTSYYVKDINLWDCVIRNCHGYCGIIGRAWGGRIIGGWYETGSCGGIVVGSASNFVMMGAKVKQFDQDDHPSGLGNYGTTGRGVAVWLRRGVTKVLFTGNEFDASGAPALVLENSSHCSFGTNDFYFRGKNDAGSDDVVGVPLIKVLGGSSWNTFHGNTLDIIADCYGFQFAISGAMSYCNSITGNTVVRDSVNADFLNFVTGYYGDHRYKTTNLVTNNGGQTHYDEMAFLWAKSAADGLTGITSPQAVMWTDDDGKTVNLCSDATKFAGVLAANLDTGDYGPVRKRGPARCMFDDTAGEASKGTLLTPNEANAGALMVAGSGELAVAKAWEASTGGAGADEALNIVLIDPFLMP